MPIGIPAKFKFNCPFCGQHISAAATDVHTTGVCPGCGREVEVPTPTQITDSSGRKNSVALAIGSLILCMAPGLALTLLRLVGHEISGPQFAIIYGIVALSCVTGLVFAHIGFFRSKGRLSLRLIFVVNFIMGYFSALSMVIILLGLLSGTMVLHKPNFEPPDFAAPELYPATPQNEADEKAGFNLGRPLGAKRSLDGLPFPSDEFLDSIIKTTIPNKSEAFKQGFKAGYFDGWQSRDGKPI